jgi:hypothetical protein
MSNVASLHSIDVQKEPIPKIKAASLAELTPRTYSTVRARVVIIKSREKKDELGKRNYIFGICEDQSFRSPFISYKPNSSLFRECVFDFKDCYVHEFDDKSLLLIATELSSIDYLPEENPANYVWNPKIGDLRRSTGSCRVTLQGTLSQISSSSGLVQRCETCSRVAFEGKCPNDHENKLFWAVRVAGRLADRTTSINVVFSQYLACRLLGRTIGEVLQLAEGPATFPSEFIPESLELQLPSQLQIGEAYAEEPDHFRSHRNPVVVDLNDSRIIYPNNVKPQDSFGRETKTLDLSKPEDRRDLLRLSERLFEIQIRSVTKLPKINGIYLLENPAELYRTENAKLYVGFKLKLDLADGGVLKAQALPCAEVYESVLDYVSWRRKRGASANAIKNALITYRKNVVFAPSGELACIVNLVFKKARDFVVPAYDLGLPEYWSRVHDIAVDADETPLVVAKSYRLDLELTFPPSCVFFDRRCLRLTWGTQRFIDRKRQQVRTRTKEILQEVAKGFSLGDFKLETLGEGGAHPDARGLLLADIREKLLGKTIKATGSVIQSNQRLYFIPRTVDGVF